MEQVVPVDRRPHNRASALDEALDALALPGIDIGWRDITTGDEFALSPGEFRHFADSVVKVRRASGAARLVARELFKRHGMAIPSIPKSPEGVPLWPEAWVGSLAHDARLAVAAIARRRDFAGIGIDIEPAEILDNELLEWVTTPREREALAADPFCGRLHFAVKEAVYKAVYPLDREFLEHHDVEVDLENLTAQVNNGRRVHFRYGLSPHIVVLAVVASDASQTRR